MQHDSNSAGPAKNLESILGLKRRPLDVLTSSAEAKTEDSFLETFDVDFDITCTCAGSTLSPEYLPRTPS
jgi:hypothetical protein